MYLRKLEISGFKSFGSKETLDLEPGIMAVVGPNGSGKSNIADALRWVLGEQSNKMLRLRKSEELIFAGSEKKSKSSMAKVNILLDNTDEQMPIDFREVSIARCVYPEGENDYFLNGKKSRLSDITQILLQSGFGQSSYSIIGQGMVDNLILATGQERKELFEEASGIKQYEIKKQLVIKKLDKTKQNLIRVNDIISELLPQQKVLDKQIQILSQKNSLLNDLQKTRHGYLDYQYSEYKFKSNEIKELIKSYRAQLDQVTDEIDKLHNISHSKSKNDSQQNNFQESKLKLRKYEAKRDELFQELSNFNAKQKLLSGKDTLKKKQDLLNKLTGRKNDLDNKLKELKLDIKDRQSVIEQYDQNIKKLNKELDKTRILLTDSSAENYLKYAVALVKILSSNMSTPVLSNHEYIIVLTRLEKMIHLARKNDSQKLSEKIKSLQKDITQALTKKDNLNELQTTKIIRSRAIEIDLININNQINSINSELLSLSKENSLKQKAELEKEIRLLEKNISSTRESIINFNNNDQKDMDKKLISNLEKLSAQRAELKIRLNNKEKELSDQESNFANLKKVSQKWLNKEYKFSLRDDIFETKLEKITRIEAELEIIGEIDPQLEQQYKSNADRIEFLTTQKEDLSKAASDLEEVINNLDKNIKEKFEKSFSNINKYFGKYFEELFGGGIAKLILAKDTFDKYGIEIKVKLPGKNMELLSSLSGGEKTLAALALLVAIVSVNPSPFIVLDEVDAALDDTNCLKFSKLLGKISSKSQIIIITHNHQTMKIATKLFGVTSTNDCVSKVLSVKLKQAEEMVLEPSS